MRHSQSRERELDLSLLVSGGQAVMSAIIYAPACPGMPDPKDPSDPSGPLALDIARLAQLHDRSHSS